MQRKDYVEWYTHNLSETRFPDYAACRADLSTLRTQYQRYCAPKTSRTD